VSDEQVDPGLSARSMGAVMSIPSVVPDSPAERTPMRRARGARSDPSVRNVLTPASEAEAARRMFVHYNTLKNRLDRIEDIIGPVLSDPARALECEVAIYVDRHYDLAWEALDVNPSGGVASRGDSRGRPAG
jgi:hypothetical protein